MATKTERSPFDLFGGWLCAYVAVWAATLALAALVALVGRPLALQVRQILRLRLTPHGNPPPDIGHALELFAHNLPITAWPLLLGVVGAHRQRLSRAIADIVLLACVGVNTAQVGAALGAYSIALLPYIPQLPLEWAGLALGVSAWLLQREQALGVRQALLCLGLIACLLLSAAMIETVAVPHRS